jgi:hypothetical protein
VVNVASHNPCGFVLLSALTAAGFGASCRATPAPTVAPVSADTWAVVGGKTITREDVDKAYRRTRDLSQTLSDEETLTAKLSLLNDLTLQEILIAKAAALSFVREGAKVEVITRDTQQVAPAAGSRRLRHADPAGFDRGRPAEHRMPGLIDRAHAAFAERLNQLVFAQRRAGADLRTNYGRISAGQPLHRAAIGGIVRRASVRCLPKGLENGIGGGQAFQPGQAARAFVQQSEFFRWALWLSQHAMILLWLPLGIVDDALAGRRAELAMLLERSRRV